jgi:hypothetical protein
MYPLSAIAITLLSQESNIKVDSSDCFVLLVDHIPPQLTYPFGIITYIRYQLP